MRFGFNIPSCDSGEHEDAIARIGDVQPFMLTKPCSTLFGRHQRRSYVHTSFLAGGFGLADEIPLDYREELTMGVERPQV